MSDYKQLAETMDWSLAGSVYTDAHLMTSLAYMTSPLSAALLADRSDASAARDAKQAFIDGLDGQLLSHIRRNFCWDFLDANSDQLRQRGIFEACVLRSHVCTFSQWTAGQSALIRRLFSLCDRERLRAAGSAFPGDGPFKLYRGVCGDEGLDGVAGWSWTDDRNRARFFAQHFARFIKQATGTKLPLAVLSATVPVAEILVYIANDDREFIAQPSSFERMPVEYDPSLTVKAVFGVEAHS